MKIPSAWPSLVLLLAGGCKPGDLVCLSDRTFEVLQPEKEAGAAPFSIDRPGPEVKGGMEERPDAITLKGDNHARVEWLFRGHVRYYSDVIYSPGEGIVRDVDDPTDVHPMRRSSVWLAERVWFGFRSTRCRDPEGWSSECVFGGDKLFLVAEMKCHRE